MDGVLLSQVMKRVASGPKSTEGYLSAGMCGSRTCRWTATLLPPPQMRSSISETVLVIFSVPFHPCRICLPEVGYRLPTGMRRPAGNIGLARRAPPKPSAETSDNRRPPKRSTPNARSQPSTHGPSDEQTPNNRSTVTDEPHPQRTLCWFVDCHVFV
jgi:hypothetical protein